MNPLEWTVEHIEPPGALTQCIPPQLSITIYRKWARALSNSNNVKILIFSLVYHTIVIVSVIVTHFIIMIFKHLKHVDTRQVKVTKNFLSFFFCVGNFQWNLHLIASPNSTLSMEINNTIKTNCSCYNGSFWKKIKNKT